MMKSALVGSWYNTGFYGHYRGQFKCEIAQEYRLAAKPQPPAVFLQRLKEPPDQHLFSKHDNRGVFDPGIGKRKAWEKLKKKCNVFNWPYDETQKPLVSSYQKDYHKEPGGMDGPLLQPLVHYIQAGIPQSLDVHQIPSTTYQHTFCHQLVNHLPDETFKKEVQFVNQMPDEKFKKEVQFVHQMPDEKFKKEICESKEKLGTSPSPGPETLPELVTVNHKKTEPFLHLTVSDCLQWIDPLKKAG
ncbi:ciliary microtubule inner protein 7 [Macrotis lagotis]|uniref:ciliary microtubule inner protein 7 n=1 Tax=Macrotis lagotis TaxID=92651 RepID=UPI003D68F2BC